MKEKRITVYSYGKINLSLDVLGVTDDGYHEVEMIMQAILLHDDVEIRWKPYENSGADTKERASEFTIKIHTNLPYVPDDERNIAYKAALLMYERFGHLPEESKKRKLCGKVEINIKKRIPVAAGLAGGSGNGAAVIMGLAYLWKLDLSLEELMRLGAELGSDVPFSVMSQAACNGRFGYKDDPMAATCALAAGRGTKLRPLKQALKSDILLCKPDIPVSTAEVYRGIDNCTIDAHPDNAALEAAIIRYNAAKDNQILPGEPAGRAERDNEFEYCTEQLRKNMINVLEKYTLYRYDKVKLTKNCNEKNTEDGAIVLMSGSGPTIFTLCGSSQEAKKLARKVAGKERRAIVTRTLI